MNVKVAEFRRDLNDTGWVLENTLAEWKDANPWCAVNYMQGYADAMKKYRKIHLSCPCSMSEDGYKYYNYQVGYMVAVVDKNNSILKNL